MFQKILIANRGEIACRIATTARRLGIATVAVYSEADASAAHVSVCDEAIRIGEAPARDSYLHIQRIVEAAATCGAQAVHPGYGFLSESPAFANACQERGLVFIGPSAESIAAMGDKAAAKVRMASHGVPVLPGYNGADQDDRFLARQADLLGYPLMIKACAGGGGRGMRVVRNPEQFEKALAACQREASSFFGDPSVLLERYIERPRHIEMQIFSDGQGNCVHLFERDCSIQRRHQKVLEESPAIGVTSELRERMGRIAIDAARAIDYRGAGTVEFIVETDNHGRLGNFYFMEMNTRLQVEHPVTELVTGLDLVEWQLRVAAGEPLPLGQEAISLRGHALEVRLCAERPEKNFLPSSGVCKTVRFPQAELFSLPLKSPSGPFVRVDSGVRSGDCVTPFYDALLAKLIVWAPNRIASLDAMQSVLAGVMIEGVSTNRDFLAELVVHPRVVSGQVDTLLVDQVLSERVPLTGVYDARE